MNKRILLIGGSQGIGFALCEELKNRGADTVVICRSKKNLEANIHHIEADAVDWNCPLPYIEGNFDGLVYLPGTITLKPFTQLKIDDFRRDMEINYFGAVRVLQHFLPKLKEDSSIVLMSSVAASLGLSYHASIGSAKAAIEGLTLALSAELAPKIRVNSIAPSITTSPLSEKFLDTAKKTEHAIERHPLKKIGEPKDIAKAIVYLLSDDSRWMTGQILHIDGGLSSVRPL